MELHSNNQGKPKLPSNKTFGLFFSFVFFVASIFCFYLQAEILSYLTIFLAFSFFTIALLNDQILAPLNELWMKFGSILGAIISPIVLGLIFFGIFSPIAIISKIFQRDELALKRKQVNSYWKLRDCAGEKTDFTLQY